MKQRKTFLGILLLLVTVISTVCLFACDDKKDSSQSNPPATVTVTYVYNNGQADSVATLMVGQTAIEPADPVKADYDFTGWYLGENKYDFSTPVNQNITLTAGWVEKVVEIKDCTVTVRNYDFLTYKGEFVNGTYTLKQGETVTIAFDLSPYYDGTPVVKAGEEVIEANEKGEYVFTVTSNVVVTVEGLTAQNRTIVGLGTENSPYLIKNETQFEQFIARVNSASDGRYNNANVRLEADLDFNGIELNPIGKELNVSHFSGVFDGNGHTVANFEINEESGVIGLFGYLVQGVVKNLTVKTDWYLDMLYENNYIVGGIVGYNMGGDIYGCKFEGSIDSELYYDYNTDNIHVFMGGISGFVQGYSTDWYASVAYCEVNADFNSVGIHPLYAVGGIAGAVIGTAESAPVLINNCVYQGDVTGKNAMVGGVVGYLRNYASVANCYTAGNFSADNENSLSTAGGLVGLAENETAVTYSYTCATLFTNGEEDSDFIYAQIIGAKYKNGEEVKNRTTSVDGKTCLELGLVKGEEIATQKNFKELLQQIGWLQSEWIFSEGKIIPNAQNMDKAEVTVTVSFGGESVTNEGHDGEDLTLTQDQITTKGYYNAYLLYGGSGKNTFVADSGKISYGYFLDEECTQRIPASMLLTQNTTIYVGFASYKEVQGEYYLVFNANEKTTIAHIIFDDNGKMTMEYDGRVENYMFVYDGERILISNGYFANFLYESVGGSLLKTDFYAEITENGLTIYDNIFFTEENEEEYAKPLKAIIPSLALGKWYDANGNTYTFTPDGKVTVNKNGAITSLTYTSVGEKVTIYNAESEINATVSDGVMIDEQGVLFARINKFDIFAGKWEASFSTNHEIYFDGKGSVTYKGKTTAYTLNGETATFNGGSATFDKNGLLLLTVGENKTVMGREGSYIGYWKETLLGYDFELYGIGKEGYGYGYDNNGISFTYTSELDSLGLGEYFLNFYYGTSLYGYAYSVKSNNDGSEMLYAAIYTEAQGALWDNYNLCYEDHYKGVWNNEEGISLDFNGLGRYNVYYDDIEGLWVVQGNVTVTQNGEQQTVRYYFSRETGKVTFTYKGVAYTAEIVDNQLIAHFNGVTATYKQPDALGGIMFEGENILLGFNGKSNVGLGKAQLSLNGGDLEEYDYTLNEVGEVTITNGTNIFTGEISEKTSLLELTFNGEKYSLGYFSYLSNKTYISNSGLEIKIEGYFNLAGEAIGYIDGDKVDLVYMDENTSVVYYSGAIVYYLVAQDYYNVAIFDEYVEYLGMFTISDGYRGEYIGEDGRVLTLDGMSNLLEGYYAVATLTDENGEIAEYVYKVEDGNVIVYILDRNGETDATIPAFILSKEKAEGAVAFTCGEITLYLKSLAIA